MLAGCGNPGGLSDAQYNEYKQLGAPKILYSCTTTSDGNNARQSMECLGLGQTSGRCSESSLEKAKTRVNVGYVAGVGPLSTYNKIIQDLQAECPGKLDVLDSKQ
jgi:hypothetical protein